MGWAKFISSSLTSPLSGNKEIHLHTHTHLHTGTQSCLIKLGKQLSSEGRWARAAVSAIYKLLPQISQVPCEWSCETCHWKRSRGAGTRSNPANCSEKEETHNLHVLFYCCHDDNATLASCPHLPLKENDARWDSPFACIRMMFHFTDSQSLKFLIHFRKLVQLQGSDCS